MLLSTLHGNHAERSGYQALAGYLPEGRFLHTVRADPAGGVRGARVAGVEGATKVFGDRSLDVGGS
jgi:hypothetical protein